jgi:hypothetical protein
MRPEFFLPDDKLPEQRHVDRPKSSRMDDIFVEDHGLSYLVYQMEKTNHRWLNTKQFIGIIYLDGNSFLATSGHRWVGEFNSLEDAVWGVIAS